MVVELVDDLLARRSGRRLCDDGWGPPLFGGTDCPRLGAKQTSWRQRADTGYQCVRTWHRPHRDVAGERLRIDSAGHVARGKQCSDLRRENEAVRINGVEERLLAQPIPHEDELPPRCRPDREGEEATEVRED